MKSAIIAIVLMGVCYANEFVSSVEFHFGNHMMDNPTNLPDGDPATPSIIINTGLRGFKELGEAWWKLKPGIGLSYYRAGYGVSPSVLTVNLPKQKTLLETYELELIGDFLTSFGNNEIYGGLMYNLPLFGTITYTIGDDEEEKTSQGVGFLGSVEEGKGLNPLLYLRVGYKYFFSGKYGVGVEFNKGLNDFVEDAPNSTKNAFNLSLEYKL